MKELHARNGKPVARRGRKARGLTESGTAGQRQEVRFAPEVSRFNWSLVPETITIHLHSGSDTHARPGEIWIDTKLLASGVFAWGPIHGPDHASLGSERFASTLAWSYWQSPANSLKPTSPRDESAAMAPAAFRSLLGRLLGHPGASTPILTVG